MDNFPEIILRLVIALIVGGAIGIERAGTNHDAGLRTHILVCLGAAVAAITGQALYTTTGGDISRLGAQVISGIGFLGAGCILVNGSRIKGLTTAAGLWATACVGLAIGYGFYMVAVTAAVLILVAMLILRPVGSFIQRFAEKKYYTFSVLMDSREYMEYVTEIFYSNSVQISSIDLRDSGEYIFKVENQTDIESGELIAKLMDNKHIKSAKII